MKNVHNDDDKLCLLYSASVLYLDNIPRLHTKKVTNEVIHYTLVLTMKVTYKLTLWKLKRASSQSVTKYDSRPTTRIKADRPLMCDTLNAPGLLTNRQFKWTGNGHSQLPLAELGKPSPNIDLLCTTGSNGRAKINTQFFTVWPWPLTYDLQSQASQGQDRPSCQKSRSKVKTWFKQESAHKWTDTQTHAHTRMLPNVSSPLLHAR